MSVLGHLLQAPWKHFAVGLASHAHITMPSRLATQGSACTKIQLAHENTDAHMCIVIYALQRRRTTQCSPDTEEGGVIQQKIGPAKARVTGPAPLAMF